MFKTIFLGSIILLLSTFAFAQNKSNLDSLIHQTKLSDFSILIANSVGFLI